MFLPLKIRLYKIGITISELYDLTKTFEGETNKENIKDQNELFSEFLT